VRDLTVFISELEKSIIGDMQKVMELPIDQKVEYYKIFKPSLIKDLEFLSKLKDSQIDEQTKMLQDLILTLDKSERTLLAEYLLEIIKKRRSINN
jgi:hypothetical protein